MLLALTLAFSVNAFGMPDTHRTFASTQEVKEIKPAFGGRCAMGLCNKKVGKGSDKYMVDYKGERYLFSSESQRDEFISDIDKNIEKAKANYQSMGLADKK